MSDKPKECVHGHKKKTSGCVSCELLWNHSDDLRVGGYGDDGCSCAITPISACPVHGSAPSKSDDLLTLRARAEQARAALIKYIEYLGALHDDDCPADDTCDCTEKRTNDGVNDAVRLLSLLAEQVEAEKTTKAEHTRGVEPQLRHPADNPTAATNEVIRCDLA